MSDCFNHACDAFDSLGQDHIDTPIKGYYKKHYNCFTRDPLYYHSKHKVTLAQETEKAYRFKSDKGIFWVAKKICKKYDETMGTVRIWKGAKLVYQQEEVKA